MPTLPSRTRRRVERGLAELRQLKSELLHDVAQEEDELRRASVRRLVDVVEVAVFDLERLLHPANGE